VNLSFSSQFPQEATFDIVGPNHPADVDIHVFNNVEDGSSAARGTSAGDPPCSFVTLPFCTSAPLLLCSPAPLLSGNSASC
jgi:hypothetical protein